MPNDPIHDYARQAELRQMRIVKKGTQALIVLKGDPRVSVTQTSAQYILATILLPPAAFLSN